MLCNVLFLTCVWGYGILEAGLAITPGPFAAAAGRARRQARRPLRLPAVIVPGQSRLGGGARLPDQPSRDPSPNFVSERLPGQVILGIGAGAGLPTVSGAAVASAPGEALRHSHGAQLCLPGSWAR